MMRRMGRPGLVGTMARTAVVAGTATAVAGGVSRHQQGKQQAAATETAAQQAAFDSQQQVAEMQAADGRDAGASRPQQRCRGRTCRPLRLLPRPRPT